MIYYTVIASSLTLIYVFLFLFYLIGWLRLRTFIPAMIFSATKVSIIIPARNEEKNIGNLLNDLLAQSYPSAAYEIIVIDDHSEDKTVSIVRTFSSSLIHLLHLNDFISDAEVKSYKKKALEYGIEKATGELIITTDADCRVGKDWLFTIVNFYESNNCHMVVSPVLFTGERNIFDRIQSLDLLGLAGITGATLFWNIPTMCNGANLAFRKESFRVVNGYDGIDEVSSGDDLLLMYKMAKQWKHGVQFLKNSDAAAYTFPQKTLNDLISQRIRWTSKSKHFKNTLVIMNLLLIYFFNASILISLALSFFNKSCLPLFVLQMILKIIAELAFLIAVTKFFKREKLLSLFLPVQLLHSIYIVFIGFAGNIFKTKWKGRKIS